MKTLIRIFFGLVIVIVFAVVGIYFYVNSLKPNYEEDKSMELSEQVDVRYDEYGIPHIYAQTNEDAFKILGYVHAKDRLSQMEMLRRVGSGRLAELLGPELAKADKFFRTPGLTPKCKAAAEQILSSTDEHYTGFGRA